MPIEGAWDRLLTPEKTTGRPAQTHGFKWYVDPPFDPLHARFALVRNHPVPQSLRRAAAPRASWSAAPSLFWEDPADEPRCSLSRQRSLAMSLSAPNLGLISPVIESKQPDSAAAASPGGDASFARGIPDLRKAARISHSAPGLRWGPGVPVEPSDVLPGVPDQRALRTPDGPPPRYGPGAASQSPVRLRSHEELSRACLPRSPVPGEGMGGGRQPNVAMKQAARRSDKAKYLAKLRMTTTLVEAELGRRRYWIQVQRDPRVEERQAAACSGTLPEGLKRKPRDSVRLHSAPAGTLGPLDDERPSTAAHDAPRVSFT